jgi:hypothetical protein
MFVTRLLGRLPLAGGLLAGSAVAACALSPSVVQLQAATMGSAAKKDTKAAKSDAKKETKAAKPDSPEVELLNKQRTIILSSTVDATSAKTVVAKLLYLDKVRKEKASSENAGGGEEGDEPIVVSNVEPIVLYIMTPGGNINAGMAIYDMMQFVEVRPAPARVLRARTHLILCLLFSRRCTQSASAR